MAMSVLNPSSLEIAVEIKRKEDYERNSNVSAG